MIFSLLSMKFRYASFFDFPKKRRREVLDFNSKEYDAEILSFGGFGEFFTSM